MIANQKSLYEFIDQVLKPYGFIKKKDTWYLTTSECICYLVVSKSPFAGRYEELMGVFLKEMGVEENFPSYEKGHLKSSIEHLTRLKEIKQILNLENQDFKENEREIEIRKIIEAYAIPFLLTISTKQGIIEAINEHENLVHYARSSLKEKLGIPDEEE